MTISGYSGTNAVTIIHCSGFSNFHVPPNHLGIRDMLILTEEVGSWEVPGTLHSNKLTGALTAAALRMSAPKNFVITSFIFKLQL